MDIFTWAFGLLGDGNFWIGGIAGFVAGGYAMHYQLSISGQLKDAPPPSLP